MDIGVILRRPNGSIQGSSPHRDNRPFAMLSVIKSDGSSTRIIDFASVLKEAEARPELHKLEIKLNNNETFTLAHLIEVFPNLEEKDMGLKIEILPEQNQDKVATLEAIISRYSANIYGGPSIIAFWGNRGRVFHQAMPSLCDSDLTEMIQKLTIAASPPRH